MASVFLGIPPRSAVDGAKLDGVLEGVSEEFSPGWLDKPMVRRMLSTQPSNGSPKWPVDIFRAASPCECIRR